MLLIWLQDSGALHSLMEAFVRSTDDSGWEETASDWLVAGILVAVACTILMVLVKWVRKRQARNILQRTWSASHTIQFILAGFVPALLALIGTWYFTRNFYNYISLSGLFGGILAAAVLYMLLMSLAHFVSPWRRDLF